MVFSSLGALCRHQVFPVPCPAARIGTRCVAGRYTTTHLHSQTQHSTTSSPTSPTQHPNHARRCARHRLRYHLVGGVALQLSPTMAEDHIHSFLSTYEQSDADHIPAQHRPQCCCGNESCVFLRHNQSALEGLEKDVSTAARLGKVCDSLSWRLRCPFKL